MSMELIESPSQLAVVVEQNGLAAADAKAVLESFQGVFATAHDLAIAADKIQVTDATQVKEMKAARAMRLKLKEVRVESEKIRKQLKEDSLRRGKAIDGVANVIKFIVEPVEQRLLEQEQFAERREAERIASTKAVREELLKPYGIDTSYYQLGEMAETTFAQLLDGSRLAHEAKLEQQRKAEADRIAKEAADRAERERVQAENEKLRKDAEARELQMRKEREAVAVKQAEILAKAAQEMAAAEAKAAKERAALEAKAKKEREAAKATARNERDAREKLEAEKLAAEKARAKREADEAKSRRKAEMAPDREKLVALAASLRSIPIPNVSSDKARQSLSVIVTAITTLASRIVATANTLEESA